jgi:diacylglycerol kinase family enzyme
MNILNILNPSRRNRARVRAILDARHLSSPWAWVAREHPDHTDTLVQWALNEGVRRLVVWGGDGTLHRVVESLWRREALDKVEVALVPAGTCNDLARRVGLRFAEWPSWQTDAPDGRKASMALGILESNGRRTPFVNNAGFGRPKASFDRKDPPWRVISSFSPIPVTARWADGELRGIYFMGLFCLGPYFSGGLHFEPEPSPERGDIRTFLLPARTKLRLASRLVAARVLRTPLSDTKVTAFSSTGLSLRSEVDVWPQADGEPPSDNPVREMTLSLEPSRWSLWVPS